MPDTFAKCDGSVPAEVWPVKSLERDEREGVRERERVSDLNRNNNRINDFVGF